MMKTCVIDTSFMLSYVLEDEASPLIQLKNYRVYVPTLFFLECTNVLGMALKKGRITPPTHQLYLEAICDLDFHLDSFSMQKEAILTLNRLMQKHELTSYDACYLELALRLGSPLGTYDKKLQTACTKAKVPLL